MKKAAATAAAFLFGGDEEDRTPDLRIANATLSQLSYVPSANDYIEAKNERQAAAGGAIAPSDSQNRTVLLIFAVSSKNCPC